MIKQPNKNKQKTKRNKTKQQQTKNKKQNRNFENPGYPAFWGPKNPEKLDIQDYSGGLAGMYMSYCPEGSQYYLIIMTTKSPCIKIMNAFPSEI